MNNTKKLSNDENIKNLRIRKNLRILMIVFASLTIVLAILNLFYDINLAYALLTCISFYIVKWRRDVTPINRKDELKDVKETIEKVKRKKKV